MHTLLFWLQLLFLAAVCPETRTFLCLDAELKARSLHKLWLSYLFSPVDWCCSSALTVTLCCWRCIWMICFREKRQVSNVFFFLVLQLLTGQWKTSIKLGSPDVQHIVMGSPEINTNPSPRPCRSNRGTFPWQQLPTQQPPKSTLVMAPGVVLLLDLSNNKSGINFIPISFSNFTSFRQIGSTKIRSTWKVYRMYKNLYWRLGSQPKNTNRTVS